MSLVPFPVIETYQLPDLLSLFSNKPGGPISAHFKGAHEGYNEWVRATLGYFFSVVCYVVQKLMFMYKVDCRLGGL